jgi:membrane fusion protein (multidrug efflux system)
MTDQTMPDQDKRANRLRYAMVAGFVLVLVAGVALWLLLTRYGETTEDAYVEGNIVPVTSQVSGTVTMIGADNTDHVEVGQALVSLNDTDARLAFDSAKAALGKAVRATRAQYRLVDQSQADLRARRNDVRKAEQDLARRLLIAESGAVSGEELAHARNILANARDGLDGTQQALAQRSAMVDNVSLRQHPDVVAAASNLRTAFVNLKRTNVAAPVTGTITKRSVQVGQRIAPAMAMMAIVPLDNLWVNANFKESQLQHLRIGQPVELIADVYGNDTVFHGRIIGLDAGTGSAFALLPAQNATGNWIKVTQRIPVRIALDPREINRNPLRIGLSMHVRVDTRDRSGAVLSGAKPKDARYTTSVFNDELADADALIDSIVRANAGGSSGR